MTTFVPENKTNKVMTSNRTFEECKLMWNNIKYRVSFKCEAYFDQNSYCGLIICIGDDNNDVKYNSLINALNKAGYDPATISICSRWFGVGFIKL